MSDKIIKFISCVSWEFSRALEEYYAVLQIGRSLVRSQLVSLEFFIDNPSDRTKALGSNQTLTEMSTRSISWG